jgi:hypothetical protein
MKKRRSKSRRNKTKEKVIEKKRHEGRRMRNVRKGGKWGRRNIRKRQRHERITGVREGTKN